MGNTFKLGNYVNGIFQDASNNVGIGGSPSGSYKLEVTGTAKVSSTLLVGSTLTANDGTFSGSGVDGSLGSVVRISTTNTNGNARNWALVNTFDSYGDLNFRLSTAQGGNALSAGSTVLTLSRTGAATFSGDLTIAARMYIKGGNQNSIWFNQNAGGSSTGFLVGRSLANTDAQDFFIYDIAAATARMVITSNGNLLVGTTTDPTAGVIVGNQSTNNWAIYGKNTASTGVPYVFLSEFTGQSPNNTTGYFYYAGDQSASRFQVRSNGGIYNYSGNNVNLSDASTKKDIIPCESYWDKFKAIEIVKFKYIDQTHDDYNIGVIAQQLEKVAPEFIDEENWAKPNEEVKIMKAVYTEDLHNATIKVLQEAMTKIEEQQAQIQSLQEQNQDLKSRLDKAGL